MIFVPWQPTKSCSLVNETKIPVISWDDDDQHAVQGSFKAFCLGFTEHASAPDPRWLMSAQTETVFCVGIFQKWKRRAVQYLSVC